MASRQKRRYREGNPLGRRRADEKDGRCDAGYAVVTSKASNTPKRVSQEDISEYDKAIQELLPDILSSLMVVSAFDTDVSDKMAPLPYKTLPYKIFSVDRRIAQASTQFETAPQSNFESLAELRNTEVLPLYDELAQG